MNRRQITITALVLLFYVIAAYIVPTFLMSKDIWLRLVFKKVCPLLLILLALFTIHKQERNLWEAWGVRSGFGRGLGFAFLMTLPMLIAYSIVSQININITPNHIFYGVLIAPIFEELLYRGFLFGQLYRFGGWGFVPAGLLNALIFGALHLYQAHDFGSAIAVFAVTALGGLWFAWLYAEWNYNLWIPIFLHLFMNAWWMIFEIDSSAIGGWYANIFRAITIVTSIIITIRIRKKQGKWNITKNTLLLNKKMPLQHISFKSTNHTS